MGGAGVLPQTVLLTGTGIQGASVTTLTANTVSALIGQPVTFTAEVQPSGAGTVSFYDGPLQLGTAQATVNHTTSLTVSSLGAGTHSITAVYSGTAGFAGSVSAPVSVLIGDFDFSITSGGMGSGTGGNTGSGAGSSTGNGTGNGNGNGTGNGNGNGNGTGMVNQTVLPGQSVSYPFLVQPLAGPFNFPVTLSATGLPPGATVVFSPQVVTVGAAPASFTMKIQTTATVAGLRHTEHIGGGSLAFALLLLPFSGAVRRRARKLGVLTLCLTLVGTGVVMTTITGCAGGNGFFGVAEKTYTVQVIGTARGAAGTTLQHVANVQLTLQ